MNKDASERPMRPDHVPRCGFTLIELLTVITILGLLISIILPSLGKARTMARTTKTKALFNSISTGLEMFHDDHVVGGEYPPSVWHTSGGNPYDAEGIPSPDPFNGAHTLLWALLGADLLGTPGFDVDPNLDLSALTGLYRLDSGKPAHHRSGPFLDLSQTELSETQYHTILDAFKKKPVLYYRANTDATDPKQIYTKSDNDGFISGHPLEELTAFEKFVRNPKITAVYRPHNSNTYLLISAGPDEEYGTEDDVTNFPLTGENFEEE